MRRWIALCLPFLLLAALTACAQGKPDSTPPKEKVAAHETDNAVTVSTAAELIAAIAPDTHILLKPGDYNFSALTEDEISECGGYVNPDSLANGELTIYNAHGFTIEAEESGSVRFITENGYADVVTLTLCDGAVLKGLVIGHEIEKGECDADVLRIDTCKDVTVEDCGLFGCGADGIWAEKADRLTVTKTDIYECTSSIFSLVDTGEAVFDGCRFYDNDGMFFLWGKTEVLVRDTEIFQNRNPLLEGDPEDVCIAFRGCTFRDNLDMGIPEDWSCASFENCGLTASHGAAYDALLSACRSMLADPSRYSGTETSGGRGIQRLADNITELYECEARETVGYLIRDFSGDSVPELLIACMPGYEPWIGALYTLVDGEPRLVLSYEDDSAFAYLGNGTFFCLTSNGEPPGRGQGIYHLTKDGTALECDSFDFFFYDEYVVYHNTTGSFDVSESRESVMDAGDFNAYEGLEPEYETAMTPFSDG